MPETPSRVRTILDELDAPSGRDSIHLRAPLSFSVDVAQDLAAKIGFALGDLGFAISIDARIASKNPATDRLIFTSQTHVGTPAYVRNPNCWAAGIDLTSVSVWNSHFFTQGGGVLISPRHILLPEHFFGASGSHPVPNGTTFRWVTKDNVVVDRTLTSKVRVGVSDLCIGVLNSDVSAEISYARVLPSDWSNYMSIAGLPALMTNFNEEANVKDLSGSESGFASSKDPKRLTFDHIPITGDSGNPVMLITGGTPVLLSVVAMATSGSAIAPQFAAVNATMTSLGGGYQLTPIDLTAFVTPRLVNGKRLSIGDSTGPGSSISAGTTTPALTVQQSGTGRGLDVTTFGSGPAIYAYNNSSTSPVLDINIGSSGTGPLAVFSVDASVTFTIGNNGSLTWASSTARSQTLTNLGVSTFAKGILDDADAAAVRETIGAASATEYKYDDPRFRSLTAMALVRSVSSITGVGTGISGACYNPRSGTIFVVRNVSGAAGNIYELSINGTLIRTIANSNFIDTEAIEWVGYDAANGADVFLVGEEDHTTAANESQLTLCRLTPAATTLDRVAAGNVTTTTAYSGGNIANLGLEAIAYDSRRGKVYYTIEKRTASGSNNTAGSSDAKIFQRTVTGSGVLAFGAESVLCNIAALFSGTLTDISDMAYDPNSDTILLLSDESKKVVRLALDGTVIEQLSVSTATQPEGLAIHPDGTQLFVVGEPQEFFRYELGCHRAQANAQSYIIFKPGDTQRATNATPAADPHLSFPIAAGEERKFEIGVFFTVASATPGFKCGMTMPATTWSRWNDALTLNNVFVGGNTGLTGTNVGVDFNSLTSVGPVYYMFLSGTVKASAAGTVAFAWSQSVSDANAVTVLAGSWIEVSR